MIKSAEAGSLAKTPDIRNESFFGEPLRIKREVVVTDGPQPPTAEEMAPQQNKVYLQHSPSRNLLPHPIVELQPRPQQQIVHQHIAQPVVVNSTLPVQPVTQVVQAPMEIVHPVTHITQQVNPPATNPYTVSALPAAGLMLRPATKDSYFMPEEYKVVTTIDGPVEPVPTTLLPLPATPLQLNFPVKPQLIDSPRTYSPPPTINPAQAAQVQDLHAQNHNLVVTNDHLHRDLTTLATANTNLQKKLQALQSQNDLLATQRQALLEESSLKQLPDKHNELEALAQKVREHRTRAKEMEQMLIDAENKRLDQLKFHETQLAQERQRFAQTMTAIREDNARKEQFYNDRHNKILLELNKERQEVERLRGADERARGLDALLTTTRTEKTDLCTLADNLREQVNEIEEERNSARQDEQLMRQKLEFISKEKDILYQKIKNLEGMYRSEIGDIQNAEELLKQLKKTQLEQEALSKTNGSLKREKQELKVILKGLKDHILQIEAQRDHFENARNLAEGNLEKVSQQVSDRHSSTMDLLNQINSMKAQLNFVSKEKDLLETENKELQERLDQNLELMYKQPRSERTHSVVNKDLKLDFRCSSEGLEWRP
jgi:chromosome segregation ATPase